MIKTNSLKQDVAVIDAFRVLVIVSDFELRISDFLNENLVFVQALIIFSWMTEAVLEVNRTGGSLNPLATKELLIPILAGIVVFVSIHIISCRIRRSKPTYE